LADSDKVYAVNMICSRHSISLFIYCYSDKSELRERVCANTAFLGGNVIRYYMSSEVQWNVSVIPRGWG